MYRSILISLLAGSMMTILSASAQAQKTPTPNTSNLNLSKSNINREKPHGTKEGTPDLRNQPPLQGGINNPAASTIHSTKSNTSD